MIENDDGGPSYAGTKVPHNALKKPRDEGAGSETQESVAGFSRCKSWIFYFADCRLCVIWLDKPQEMHFT
jgi:hypothetical protein